MRHLAPGPDLSPEGETARVGQQKATTYDDAFFHGVKRWERRESRLCLNRVRKFE